MGKSDKYWYAGLGLGFAAFTPLAVMLLASHVHPMAALVAGPIGMYWAGYCSGVAKESRK